MNWVFEHGMSDWICWSAYEILFKSTVNLNITKTKPSQAMPEYDHSTQYCIFDNMHTSTGMLSFLFCQFKMCILSFVAKTFTYLPNDMSLNSILLGFSLTKWEIQLIQLLQSVFFRYVPKTFVLPRFNFTFRSWVYFDSDMLAHFKF